MPELAEAEAAAAPALEEEVDFGGEQEADPGPPPRRAAPDYGDLEDDDAATRGGPGEPAKVEQGAAEKGAPGEPRKEAILISGVQRLTRTHVAQLFEAKSLPVFKFVEWISDDQVIAIYDDEEKAATALRGVEAGFGDVTMDADGPGPGLWRAQRCMLDFRMATEDDAPSSEWKKKHRGGKQVREFRFWESMKDMSKNVLEDRGEKRAVPSGEDALAAADWDDDRQRRKRLRTGDVADEDEEEIDLLRKMADQDRSIMPKREAEDASTAPNPVYDMPLVASEVGQELIAGSGQHKQGRWNEDFNGWGRGRGGSGGGAGGWRSWQHDRRWDDDAGKGGEWQDRRGRGEGDESRQGKGGTAAQGRRGTTEGANGEGKRKRQAVEGFEVPAGEEEDERRRKRMNRFSGGGAAAEEGGPQTQ